MTAARCSACSAEFFGGVGVDAFSDGLGERATTWYCSMACAVSFMFADAIRAAKDETDYYRKDRDRLQAEVSVLRDAAPKGGRRR